LIRLELSQLVENKPLRVEMDGEGICVAKVGDEIFAIGDTCTHSDASLSEGEIKNGQIECWLHGAQFDLRTGEAVTPPATVAVPTYKVLVEGSFINISKRGE
jgi:3-phenylpropionate/trans-cinnamate dioxygenase ferredoxin component